MNCLRIVVGTAAVLKWFGGDVMSDVIDCMTHLCMMGHTAYCCNSSI